MLYITASRNRQPHGELVEPRLGPKGHIRRLPLASVTTMAKKASTETVREDKGDKVLVNFYADAAMLAKIDEYRWSNRIEGRAETVRQLVVKATS